MSDIKSMPDELSPRLQQMLAAYRSTPERDPEAARRTQARFIAELDQMFVEPPAITPAARSWVASAWVATNENLSRLFMRRSIVFLFAIFVVGACFLSGAGITAYAASSALPGDSLYSLKTTLESARADLRLDSAEQARLYMEFAGRRLVEIHSLMQKSRYTDISRAANEFEIDVQRSLRALKTLAGTDPAQAENLRTELSPVLRGYSDILSHLLAFSPESVHPALKRAIEACTAAAGQNGGNDNSTPPLVPTATPASVMPTPILEVSTPVPTPRPGGEDDKNGGENDNPGNGGEDDGGSDGDNDGGTDDDGGDDDDNGDG